MQSIQSTLRNELKDLEGILYQNPETGDQADNKSYLGNYTNRVFGAPFQLMDSVDKKFSGVNSYVGNEFLRNFMLNSPILHIRPGMPKYTGGDDKTNWRSIIKDMYANAGDMSMVSTLLEGLAKKTIFGAGSKLQRRMFGFRETYYDCMQHVNYMCRSMAIFLKLTESDKYPKGAFISTSSGVLKMEPFSTMKWENYRMLNNSHVQTPMEYLGDLIDATFIGQVKNHGLDLLLGVLNPFGNDLFGTIWDVFSDSWMNTFKGSFKNKITAMEFMVEPVAYTETLINDVAPSTIKSMIDSVSDIGSEIGFMTNSSTDTGIIDELVSFLGDTTAGLASSLMNITEPVTGGFITNLFSGAMQSIKGQKMIYPQIYKSSSSSMNYEYNITLTTPYGDVYNYYMNIIVPLLHLIALAAPRMVTANTVASPYIVQAYIPGQCSCHMGMITNMTITKNPDANHVSVNGFPLTIKVNFTITELYNAMSISPANDPASFLFNETLNDYMANLAGLIPSLDTYTKQRKAMFQNLQNYLSNKEWVNDVISPIIEKIENTFNPFIGT